MKVMCVGVSKGHDNQPDTVRVSFEDVLPPHATAVTLTVPRADLDKYRYGTLYTVSLQELPPIEPPAVVLPEDNNALTDPTETVINAS